MQRGRNHSSTFHILVKIIIFFIFYTKNIIVESKKNNGFSTELIHINLPLSPFFNYNLTHQDYIEHIGSSTLADDSSFYLMKISYGKPPVDLYHILDTGSDLSWIQCLPCTHCYDSEYAPFNPNTSGTFEFQNCPTPNKRCPYELVYEDNSHSRGDLAKETITIGSGSHGREFKNFLFGCSHDNVGYFPHKGAGIVGFNREEKSFITQLRTEHHGLFSYCMAPSGSTNAGRISFGDEAIITGNNVMSTPLLAHNVDYIITLSGISVGDEKLEFALQLIVDSGTTLVHLPNYIYSLVEKKIIKNIKGKVPIGPVDDLKLCYSSSLTDADIPKINLYFPGVVLELSPVNTFIQIPEHRCLAILPTNESYILGNMAQINFLVGFNLPDNKLSFKPTNCAAL